MAYSGMNDIARLLMAQQMAQPSMNNAMAVQQPVPQQAIPRGASRSQQLLAQQLMQAGTDTSPVGHWTQALARVVQGGVGGYMQGKQEKAEGERQSAIGEALKGAAGGNKEAAMQLLGVDPQLGLGALNLAKGEQPEAYNLSPGEARFVGNQKVAENPKVPSPEDQKRDIRVIGGQAVDFTDPAKPTVVFSAPDKPKEVPDARPIRQEFTNQSQSFVSVRDGYRKVNTASDNAAGDMSLVFGYMKMLDPGSTVREGEYALAEQARGVPDTILNLYNKSLKGERLAANQRAQFKSEAQKVYGVAEQGYKQLRTAYEGIAKRANINPEDVLIDYAGSNEALPIGGPRAAPVAAPAVGLDALLKKYGGQ